MSYYFLVQAISVCIALANFCLAGIVLTARRHRPAHWWMALIATAAGLWGVGVNIFLVSTTNMMGTAVVHAYYLFASLIPLGLVGLGSYFPHEHKWSKATKISLGIGFLLTAAISLSPSGVVQDVIVGSGGNTVVLNLGYYWVYVLYFLSYVTLAGYLFLTSYLEARRQRQVQLASQMRSMIAGMVIALIFGMYFNLILPLFGDYSFVWAGPPFTILFVVALFYAIIKQRLFDLQAALARSTAYFMLIVSLAAVYWLVIYGITSVFFLGKQMTELYAAVYVGLALIITLTYAPLKRLIDQQTHRWFYRSEYDLAEVAEEFSDITAEEIKLSPLVHRSLELLDRTLGAEYVVAYVTDSSGRLHHYAVGGRITPRQRRVQLDIVTTLLDRLPRMVDAYEIKALGGKDMQHRVSAGQMSMILQFVVQHEHIGALFIGDKRNGRSYDDKDLQLLRSVTDELALAIQNSMRFGEIQHFNETLKDKVSDATKKLRHTNRELQRLDEAKDEFVSMASHQLRTPLTSIKGYISMVMEGDAGKITDQQKQLLGEAFASSERMVHLISDFLSVSRLQTGKFIIDAQPVDLDELVHAQMEGIARIAAAHKQKLEYVRPVARRYVMADEDKIQQVIMNFMDNAVFYSRPDSTIKISLDYVGKEAVFTVKDTGIGVPEAEKEKLFTKFFRATNARKQRPDGTGVGLYLAKRVIASHGGEIIFQSKEGSGSTFGFRLPLT